MQIKVINTKRFEGAVNPLWPELQTVARFKCVYCGFENKYQDSNNICSFCERDITGKGDDLDEFYASTIKRF